MKQFLRDAFFSIAFFQIVLTPYLLFYLGLSMDQYGRWCLANMLISALLGPFFAFVFRWLYKSVES